VFLRGELNPIAHVLSCWVEVLIWRSYIKTDLNKDTRTDPQLKANFDFITSRIPMGDWGEPEDFKGVAVFMASEASAYMSGENIVIDGGYMAR